MSPLTEPLVQGAILGIVGSLLAFELVVAATSLFEIHEAGRPAHRTAVLFTRGFAIREHLQARRDTTNVSRRRYPSLRSSGHGHEVRNAIRRLQPGSSGGFASGSCDACRGSRMRGLAHCPECSLRLAARAQHG